MQTKAQTPAAYLAELPPDRRAAVAEVRKLVNDHLPEGYEEGMQYGMICWYVPLARYPDTYNGQPLGIVALASQANHLSLYLTGVYGDPAIAKAFEAAWKKTGKKLDMGKSCVRFKKVEDLALEAIADVIRTVTVEKFLARYEEVKGTTGKKPSASTTRKSAEKKPVAKKARAKK